MADGDHLVREMLSRRGFEVLLANPEQSLLFPPGLDAAFEDELYLMLRKYSFRIFAREVIKRRASFRAEDLLKYSTLEWVEKYLSFLFGLGVIEKTGEGGFRLRSEAVFSFGDTLEWFVAKVFERELSSPALWGVRLAGVSSGGDYDVVASVEGRLVYVEVKSSPPKNIEEADVAAFLGRVYSLKPAFAIFLEDTRLRMKDKIIPFFEPMLEGREIRRLQGETFSAENRIFITNCVPGLAVNIALCVREYLSREGFWD